MIPRIGPVMDALRGLSGDAIVLVTPAFPETGRTVYQGNLFVGSVPLNESPLKDHPLNPMHDSNLVRVLARQSTTRIGLVDLAAIVTRAFRRIGEDVVGAADLLEACLGGLVAGVEIGMVLLGEAAIGALDVPRARGLGDAHHLIGIFCGHTWLI